MSKWWDELIREWSYVGYFPYAKQCWLIIKQAAREVFRDTAINVTLEGYKYLSAALDRSLKNNLE